MKWITLPIFVLCCLLLFYIFQPQASSNSSKHPYVYVTASDLPLIKKKLSKEPFKTSWEQIKNDTTTLSLAFKYLIHQNIKDGNLAIQQALSQLKITEDIRPFYNAMMIGACVYDWCYPLLNQPQKEQFINEFIRLAKLHDPGFPASLKTSSIVGHNSEGWLLTGQLPAGLAIYEENPMMFDSASHLFLEKFVPVRNFSYTAHMHHQGDSYAATRFQHDIMASWLFNKAGHGNNVFCKDQQYVPYQFIYHLRPDGIQLRTGDSGDERGRSVMKRRVALLTASYYQDPYLYTLADSDLFTSFDIEDKIFEIIFRPIDAICRPLKELPLSKYFPSPMGEMVARTGWEMGVNSSDAVVHMRIGNYFFGNHQHKDFGTFQFYYKGALAINSGVYGGKDNRADYGKAHWLNYYHQTIAHNGLLVYDSTEVPSPDAKLIASNDGGQVWPNLADDHPDNLAYLLDPDNEYKMGTVTAYDFGPDLQKPDYSYIAGDITNAYHAGKAKEVFRAMLTLNTSNPLVPCILVVFDKIVSPKADLKKTWLIHSLQEPEIINNTVIIENTTEYYRGNFKYDGQLHVTSLLPKESIISKVGGKGKEYWIESVDKNFYAENNSKGAEPGHWRIEVSPKLSNKEDLFLHVLSASENDKTVSIQKPELIEGQDIVGTHVLDYFIYFNKTSELLTNTHIKISGDKQKQVFLAGIEPGDWIIKSKHGEKKINVSDDAKCAYLLLEPGENVLYLNSEERGQVQSAKLRPDTLDANSQKVLYRVNAGASNINGKPVWSADTDKSPSPYRKGGNQYQNNKTITLDDSVPENIPKEIFNSERFWNKNKPPMNWSFPVEEGKKVEVRLYLAETYAKSAGKRVFDILIDEKLVGNYVDVFALAGGSDIGIMKSYSITSDGMVDISFGRVVENPSIKAIEIVELE